jgi:hypothetical protein
MMGKWVLGLFLRMAFAFSAGACGIAIVVAQLGDFEDDGGVCAPELRMPVDQSSAPAVDRLAFRPPQASLYALDTKQGRFCRLDVPNDPPVDLASCSPWQDARGRRHVVARWHTTSGADGVDAIGLIHYVLPGREVIDRIECMPYPIGAPCWDPHRAGRVVYPASDGRLYEFLIAGERPVDPSNASTQSEAPRPLAWRSGDPEQAPLAVVDPVWPGDGRLGGRLFATVIGLDRRLRPHAPTLRQIWWLRLSPESGTIEAAKRLTVAGINDDAGTPLDEQFPNIVATPTGFVMGFLTADPRAPGRWDLRIAPLDIDSATGDPRIDLAESSILAHDRMAVRPEFSHDGRWIFSARRHADAAASVDRFSIRVPRNFASVAADGQGKQMAGTRCAQNALPAISRPAPIAVDPARPTTSDSESAGKDAAQPERSVTGGDGARDSWNPISGSLSAAGTLPEGPRPRRR